MSAISGWLGAMTNRLYPHVTDGEAAERLCRAPLTDGLGQLAGRRYCSVVSYRRDGRAVATPVWFGVAGGRLYFRTLAESFKVKRIGADPNVLVAPCTRRGRPLGDPVRGRARILEGCEEELAERTIQGNFGLIRAGYKRAIAGAPARYVEVVPVDPGAEQASESR